MLGLDYLSLLKRKYPWIKVIVISGVDAAAADVALEMGADAFLSKPFTKAALMASVNSLLNQFSVNFKRAAGTLLLLLAFGHALWAHPIQGELDKLSRTDVAILYLQLGFSHIFPFGFDHLLFIPGLFLLSPKLKPILWQATAFTIAHSVTLALAMYHVVNPPGSVVEPLISLSILYVALENIFSPKLRPARIGIVFLFGLIHGLGFAGVLGQLGLPKQATARQLQFPFPW